MAGGAEDKYGNRGTCWQHFEFADFKKLSGVQTRLQSTVSQGPICSLNVSAIHSQWFMIDETMAITDLVSLTLHTVFAEGGGEWWEWNQACIWRHAHQQPSEQPGITAHGWEVNRDGCKIVDTSFTPDSKDLETTPNGTFVIAKVCGWYRMNLYVSLHTHTITHHIANYLY